MKEKNTKQALLNNSCAIPDARRVAPISASVSSSTKRRQTLPQNASSNGGDASRVGKMKEKNTKQALLNNSCAIPDARRVAPISASVSSSTKRRQTLPQNASSNGGDASRVGKMKEKNTKQALLNNSCAIPDARRVAPISASVSSSTKRRQTLPQNASSNGGDASRVGKMKEK
ncbi:hypothetical protein, partial [Prevotellamassilia timonensis]|uniref:hypothetical protein n=1 Tax=Prevotellamassilia timonensis TaxID=1852370 RepID=UPI00307E241E